MANVRLENIKRRFNNVTAVEDITFEVPDGQFWVLWDHRVVVNLRFCGRSLGWKPPQMGTLHWDVLVNDVPARQRDVAMVFQNYALYPHMSVAQNIALVTDAQRPQHNSRTGRGSGATLSIDHLLDRKPRQLSGGQHSGWHWAERSHVNRRYFT